MASGCAQRNPYSAPWQINAHSFQIQFESATKQFRAKTHAVRRSRHFCRIFHPIRFRPLRIRINSLSKVSENSELGREGPQTTARSISVVFADLTKMMNRIRQRLGPAVRTVKPVLDMEFPLFNPPKHRPPEIVYTQQQPLYFTHTLRAPKSTAKNISVVFRIICCRHRNAKDF